MTPNYILTADDYGPINFINRGICHAVKNGLVNSVHVLANVKTAQLAEALHQLNESVPSGKSLDIGLHLTLTSGSPLYKLPGKSCDETWGKMLRNGEFKPFGQFYFGYRNYFGVIEAEFNAQLNNLREALSRVPSCRLTLTSLSHHHGIFAIDDALFAEKYAAFSKTNNLAIRSPKALPASSNNSFFGLVVPLFNLTDRKEDRLEMERMNDAFCKNRFAGKTDLTLKTPSYSEVGFYGSLGSLATIDALHKKRIAKKVACFDELTARAHSYALKPTFDPPHKVVEVVCHLGDHTQGQRGFKQAVKHYNGIDPNYFEDRQHELQALEIAAEKHKTLFTSQLTGWNNCGKVTFKAL